MTKQEEIREGMATRLDYNCEGCTLPDTISCTHPCKQQYMIADEQRQYLHSQGVVIKVDPSYTLYKETPLTAGESLIEEVKDASNMESD